MTGDTTVFGRFTEGIGTVSRRLMGATPTPVKRSLVGPYNRVQEFKADRAFRDRTLPSGSAAGDAPDHVVLVVVDALRADVVDADVCPFLDGRTVASAITPSPWTFPAVSSLVTGLYPHEHGAIRQSDESNTGATELTVPPRMPTETPTLPDLLAGAGYETYGAFAFHMPFFALSGRFGRHALYDDADAAVVLDDYLDWVATVGDRTFAYLHLADLHEPVDPPRRYWEAYDVDADVPGLSRWRFETDVDPGWAGRHYRQHRRRLYRAALTAVDDQLASLRTRLDDRLDGDVCLVVTGDHGEAFWEHTAFDAATFADSRPAYCVDHGGTPYESIARVPLAVEGLSALTPSDWSGPASLVDVAPTIASTVGVGADHSWTGTDLTAGVPGDRIPLVESTRYGYERKAAYLNGWKCIVSHGDDVVVGFSLLDEEPIDLPERVKRRLLDALPPWPDGSDADVQLSGLARDRLEDLGYV